MTIRIAVIGAGLIGRKHLGILQADPAFEVAGIADPAPQAEAYAREHGIPYFKDTEALLDGVKPDGVVDRQPERAASRDGARLHRTHAFRRSSRSRSPTPSRTR